MTRNPIIIFLLFCFLSCNLVAATDSLFKGGIVTKYKTKDTLKLPKIFDSAKVDVRLHDKYFKSLLQTNHFVYNDVPPEDNFWDKIKRLINRFINELYRTLFGDETKRNIFVMLSIIALVIIILYIIRRNSKSVLFTDKAFPKGRVILNELDKSTDFNKLIEDALSVGNYQLAFRYSYLYVLQQLVNRKLIKWAPAKTNFDYYFEIGDSGIKSEYKNLSNLFNYIEYGNFSINESDFRKTKEHFDKFKKLIEGQK